MPSQPSPRFLRREGHPPLPNRKYPKLLRLLNPEKKKRSTWPIKLRARPLRDMKTLKMRKKSYKIRITDTLMQTRTLRMKMKATSLTWKNRLLRGHISTQSLTDSFSPWPVRWEIFLKMMKMLSFLRKELMTTLLTTMLSKISKVKSTTT